LAFAPRTTRTMTEATPTITNTHSDNEKEAPEA